MKSNFDFLKNVDLKLFKIINDAEKLYRDEYFEQSIVQVRKFGEYVAKMVLGQRRTTEETFDEILGTLSDISKGNGIEKEFMDDLYFIKKQGNLCAHSNSNETAFEDALECLKRAFEVSINFAIKMKGKNKKIINQHFDSELLITGEKSSLKEKYQKVKAEESKEFKKGLNEIVKRAEAKDFKEPKKVSNISEAKSYKKRKFSKTVSKKSKKEQKEQKENKAPDFNNFFEGFFSFVVTFILFLFMSGILFFIFPKF